MRFLLRRLTNQNRANHTTMMLMAVLLEVLVLEEADSSNL
jgi:hypothetical protein